MVGTRQLLDVLRLQDRYDKQTRSVEAGAPLELLRRVELPEFKQNYRQRSERDKQTAALWRDGRALEALTRLREDNGLHLEKDRDATITKAAKLAGRDTLVICASNADTRDVGMAIRQRRQEAGEIAPDAVMVHAVDRAGEFDLPLAAGDRVRFFDRVGNGHQVIAEQR